MIRDMSVENAKFHAGTYQEDLSDDGLRIVMNVTLETDRIKDITLAAGTDIDEEFTACFNLVRGRILAANSPHIDAVAGATAQSEAVKQAVSKALMKSSREALSESGGEVVLQRYDVVIIGAGGAGLAAAIEAKDNGAKVLIVEKMPVVGGNTIKASAGMNAAETHFQKAKGIIDHKALFFQETMRGGHHKNNPSLLWYFVEHAPEAVAWLEKHGISLSDITTTGGMSVDRTHRPADRSAVGGYLISGLLKNVHQRHIDIMTNTAASEILRENGKVAGVRLRDSEGEEQIILTKGVIVATGGFSANSRMVEKYRPELKGFVTTNHAGATGDGIKLLERLGADVVDMKEIQIHPTVEQSSSYLISEAVRGGGAILVSQAGKRFVNEMETRDKVSGAIIDLPEHYAYIIFDEQIRRENKAVEQYIARNLVIEAAIIVDLAARLEMNADNLEKSLRNYNAAVAAGEDKEFGRITALRQPIDKAPFYAVRIAPGIHHTMGGVKIDPDSAVLDKEGDVIEGVWAAGEVAGGVHGGNRIGGNAVADIIIFGITAGRQAAAHKFKR
ncbi:MAG: flavocytochrome c [Candidatus Tokpelaia sp.]|nr:MAG: flavocytochrome c [Candidatus Tokpelaia sp.]KAA6207240.1 MAG: flavocytochrome c [Candidatus Tokpelaia sp.]KAA6405994.1 flavocytochrome c [Candidatus Tokpelaia sp.]